MASSREIGSARIGMMSPCIRIFGGWPSAICKSDAPWRATICRNWSRSAIVCGLDLQALTYDLFLICSSIDFFCADKVVFVQVDQCVVHQTHALFFAGLN